MKIFPCSHRPTCPGCPRYGEAGLAAVPAGKLEEIVASTGAVLDPVIDGPPLGFRVRARLAVRGRVSSPKLGIFQEGSHAIADILSCTIHHPRINVAARAVREAMRACEVAPYAERPHTGVLRYVQVVVERATGRVQIVLCANDSTPASVLALADALAAKLGDRVAGLWWNGNTERTNVIFGPLWRLLAGEECVRETIGGAAVFFPPGAFGQSNLDLADRIVADLQARVPDDSVVAELYCGVGAIGLGLVARAKSVRFNEASPQGLAGLERGLAALAPSVRSKSIVVGGDAAHAASILAGADTVIVDPPRKGLSPELVQAIRSAEPARILYLSCDPASLARDAERLVSGGRFTLTRLTPYALFPYTEHVETLAHFIPQ